jgi:protein-S-isoprenylcysteine O-methyltransferase
MTVYTWVVLAAWAVFILFWGYSAIGVKRDAMRVGRIGSYQGRIFFAIAALIVWQIVLSLARYYNVTFLLLPTHDLVFGTIGASFVVIGIAIAIWSRVYLGRDWSSTPALKEGHTLVTSGPYALVRHPIYSGMTLAMLGAAMVTPAWLVIFLCVCVMFIWRVGVEERLMTEQFPDTYPAYKARTWALIPYVW